MARPKKLVNGSMAPCRPSEFIFSIHQWTCLEKSLGEKISDELRRAISSACKDYCLRADIEAAAGLANDARDWLDSSASAAAELAGLFFGASDRSKRHAISAARAHVLTKLNMIQKAAGHSELMSFDLIITMLPEAIQAVKRDHEKMCAPTWRDGAAWDNWIVGLKSLMMAANLPNGIRNDSLEGPGFVRFVSTLQSSLPGQYRRHMPKDSDGLLGGLAKAMNRASSRRRDNPQPITPGTSNTKVSE